MEKIHGVNLGGWLVLEKWMTPEIFEGTDAEDEVTLSRILPRAEYARRLIEHRDTYITRDDFARLSSETVNLVRIPVPYTLFDTESSCVPYLNNAFSWAEEFGIKILLDLHTVPGSQNGFDNGGIIGVCKWAINPDSVKLALSVLSHMAREFGHKPALFGIEVLNEPVNFRTWFHSSAPFRNKARDRKEAKGSWFVPLSFLKKFYLAAYRETRKSLPEDKVIVFHDGFRLSSWGNFFVKHDLHNIALDTHLYITAMEQGYPVFLLPFVYRCYCYHQERMLRKASRFTPVMVGEWCISNRFACDYSSSDEEKADRYRLVAKMQQNAYSVSLGEIYWNYQLPRDHETPDDLGWRESWDYCRCKRKGWL